MLYFILHIYSYNKYKGNDLCTLPFNKKKTIIVYIILHTVGLAVKCIRKRRLILLNPTAITDIIHKPTSHYIVSQLSSIIRTLYTVQYMPYSEKNQFYWGAGDTK